MKELIEELCENNGYTIEDLGINMDDASFFANAGQIDCEDITILRAIMLGYEIAKAGLDAEIFEMDEYNSYIDVTK